MRVGMMWKPRWKVEAAEIATHLLAAETFLRERHGIILGVADYRLSFAEKLRPGIYLPLHPVATVVSVTRNGSPTLGWNVKNGILWHPTARFARQLDAPLIATVRAGWEAGKVPHTVQSSLAIICQHWIENPQIAGKDVAGDEAHQVSHRAAMFRPQRHREVATWL